MKGYDCRSRSSAELDKSQGSTGGCMQLLSGIQVIGNNHLEELHNNRKMKLPSNLGPCREERDQEWSGSAL